MDWGHFTTTSTKAQNFSVQDKTIWVAKIKFSKLIYPILNGPYSIIETDYVSVQDSDRFPYGPPQCTKTQTVKKARRWKKWPGWYEQIGNHYAHSTPPPRHHPSPRPFFNLRPLAMLRMSYGIVTVHVRISFRSRCHPPSNLFVRHSLLPWLLLETCVSGDFYDSNI